jgi:hypothetical protein
MPVRTRRAPRAFIGPIVLAAAGVALAVVGAAAQSLQLEIRVFDALEEATRDAAVRVYAAGDRSSPLPVSTEGGGYTAQVEPALYDVQVVWQPGGNIRAIRWAQALLVERYPGDAGRYIAAVNLKAGHGALQVRPLTPGDTSSWQVVAFTRGSPGREVGRVVPGNGYVLVVLPVGRYDLMVRRGGRSVLLSDLDVQADNTKPVRVAPLGD